MKILIAEDEHDILMLYKIALEARKHEVVITDNGEECLKVYHEALKRMPASDGSPFHVVLLDYRMPKKDGMEVATEILTVNPHQRIIFASAYVKDTLVDAVKQLKQVVELIQKPFGLDVFISIIEDKEIYGELEKLNARIQQIKEHEPTHEEISDLLDGLRMAMKCRTF